MRTLYLALATAILSLMPRAHVEGQDGPTFSANSELVVLHVTVRDKKGAYVTGLTKDAFNVIEDGQAQTVSLFTARANARSSSCSAMAATTPVARPGTRRFTSRRHRTP
jgi:hypothetical protein